MGVALALASAELDHEVYAKEPDGCGEISGNTVGLKGSLYSLKQIRRQCVGRLAETVVEDGLEQSRTGLCVFRMVGDEKVEIIMSVCT